jgi:uncharacterized protein (TIRG00374 family)
MKTPSNRLRAAATVTLTGVCVAYIVWKVDLRETVQILGRANLAYLSAAVGIWFAAVWPLSWRWGMLLRARHVNEPLSWLVRTYFVSYAAAQVLPTSLGGDAARIVSGTRRNPGRGDAFVGSVLFERILGGVATLVLAALGLVLAVGHYDVGLYVWVEFGLVCATAVVVIVLFSQRMRRPLARLVPLLRALRVERPMRMVYEGLHGYRHEPGLVATSTGITIGVQAVRIIGIWLIGRAVGVDLSPRPYFVMGPLLFLVMLIPFTVSGLAVREAFFVSFLGQLHVGADAAFATGFLFFLVSVLLALPGLLILGFEALGPRRRDARLLDAAIPDEPDRSERTT